MTSKITINDTVFTQVSKTKYRVEQEGKPTINIQQKFKYVWVGTTTKDQNEIRILANSAKQCYNQAVTQFWS